jgi:hypothetical protein
MVEEGTSNWLPDVLGLEGRDALQIVSPSFHDR